MSVCLITGSFDPITIGHINIVKKVLNKFDKIIVGVFNNEEKSYLFDLEKRVQLCKLATSDFKNVEVIGSNGMVSDFCKQNKIDCIVRGFRNCTDYQYETQMAQYNFEHCGVITFLLQADEDTKNISSSAVREYIANNNYDDINFLDKKVLQAIRR